MSSQTVGCTPEVEPRPGRSVVDWLRASAPALFVWSLWGLLCSSALAFVLVYGRNVPHWDDWDMVPVATGRQPLTLAWLWAPHNEHRIPLPKLLYVGLVRSCGYDLRAGMVFNVLCLGTLAAGLILAARRQRGWTSATDAFFPLALLHLGQQQNLLWGFQVSFLLGTLLVGAILIFLTSGGVGARSPWPLGVAVCLVLLPLCGSNTLAFVPGLVLWLGYLGVARRRCTATRKEGLPLLCCAAGAAGLVALYFIAFEKEDRLAMGDGPASLRTAAQFLSTAPGPAVRPYWISAAVGVIASAALTGLWLLRLWRQRPDERAGALGLGLFLAGFAVLALGVGWGRASLGEMAGLANRYVTLTAPLLCGLYLAWGQCRSASLGRIGRLFLCVLMAVLLLPNTLHGLREGRHLAEALQAVEDDARRGLTPAQIAQRHSSNLWATRKQEELTVYLEILRQERRGPFRGLDDGD